LCVPEIHVWQFASPLALQLAQFTPQGAQRWVVELAMIYIKFKYIKINSHIFIYLKIFKNTVI
jgi:hypothetical protein